MVHPSIPNRLGFFVLRKNYFYNFIVQFLNHFMVQNFYIFHHKKRFQKSSIFELWELCIEALKISGFLF